MCWLVSRDGPALSLNEASVIHVIVIQSPRAKHERKANREVQIKNIKDNETKWDLGRRDESNRKEKHTSQRAECKSFQVPIKGRAKEVSGEISEVLFSPPKIKICL